MRIGDFFNKLRQQHAQSAAAARLRMELLQQQRFRQGTPPRSHGNRVGHFCRTSWRQLRRAYARGLIEPPTNKQIIDNPGLFQRHEWMFRDKAAKS